MEKSTKNMQRASLLDSSAGRKPRPPTGEADDTARLFAQMLRSRTSCERWGSCVYNRCQSYDGHTLFG
ncbi:hypothetical protein ACS0TY_030979 [Phlomoides rotata]